VHVCVGKGVYVDVSIFVCRRGCLCVEERSLREYEYTCVEERVHVCVGERCTWMWVYLCVGEGACVCRRGVYVDVSILVWRRGCMCV